MPGIVKARPPSSPGRDVGSGAALPCCSAGKARVWWSAMSAPVMQGEGNDAGPAQQTVEAIRKAGGEAVASTLSITEPKNAEAIVKQALDAFRARGYPCQQCRHSARCHLSQDELVRLVGRDQRASEWLVQRQAARSRRFSASKAPVLSCT